MVWHGVRRRRRRRPGVAGTSHHRRHDAGLRPVPALPDRPAARVRGPLRDRRPPRLARRPGRADACPGDRAAPPAGLGGRDGRRPRRAGGERAAVRRSLLPHARRDRKSTRLNSSHDQISYAVFCLKKKKKKKKKLNNKKNKKKKIYV